MIARISQLFFLALFLFLFIVTDYRGKDEITVAVNSFFRANPLVLASYVFAVKGFTLLLLPALLMTILTLVLGRFFCGWICPLGTLIDLVTKRIPKSAPIRFLKGAFKHYLLFTLLAMAVFSVNVSGILDPIAILIRALTLFFYPLLGHTSRAGWSGLYKIAGEGRDHAAFLYDVLRDYILPFRETFYPLAFLSLAVLLFIFILERFERRNWCRNICPLGTLLGLLGRFSLFRRVPGRICKDCGDCRSHCPTAFDEEILQQENCIRCLQCRVNCRFGRVGFPFRGKSVFSAQRERHEQPVMSKRILLGSLVSGFALSRTFTFRHPEKNHRLLRPPGVTSEADFLKKCVRCGECMKVCLRSALYPDLARAGVTGIFMPVIIPRLGYCEYNCTLCGQVCPTGAIPRLPLNEKRKSVIGIAAIDKNICLPYAKKLNCIVCEEHCPIPEKAIRFETVNDIDYQGKRVTLKRPYIADDLCNGCGICENKCPLEGRSAIEVFARKKL
ncbi:MAG: 4Fe-4S binding protein [Syntrophorhabdaceae bacterium]|nr:4Fe-4S binding protein [Syntrophorhabdaceae bacterium]